MIKMAVKDTPTLLGNKLKQYYYKVGISLIRCTTEHEAQFLRMSCRVFELALLSFFA